MGNPNQLQQSIHKRRWLQNFLILLLSMFFFCGVSELGLRIYKRMWTLKNFSGAFLGENGEAFAKNTGFIYHESLGWVPKKGERDLWGTKVRILDNGIRSNGAATVAPDAAPHILTVGDSFTFGYGVADNETWPSLLEHTLGQQVLNAGVPGYGIDQTFLRAQNLLLKYSPDLLIVSLIPDDIYRAELSVRTGIRKPFFSFNRFGQLELENSPVPYSRDKIRKLDVFRKIFGYSFLIHNITIRVLPNYWIEPGTSIRVHHKGLKVATLLMEQLSEYCKTKNIQFIVVLQYDNISLSAYVQLAQKFKWYLERRSILVLDMESSMRMMMTRSPKEYSKLFLGEHDGHLSVTGNRLTAEHIQLFIADKVF